MSGAMPPGLRQLALGGIAVAVTFAVGRLIGGNVMGVACGTSSVTTVVAPAVADDRHSGWRGGRGI